MKVNPQRVVSGRPFRASGVVPPVEASSYLGCSVDGGVSYDLELRREGGGVRLRGTVSCVAGHICDRCGEPFGREYSQEVSLGLVPDESFSGSEEIGLGEEDLDVVTYGPDGIDLEHVVLETVYLEMDAPCLCRPDCAGVCTVCGRNLNTGGCVCADLPGEDQ